MDRHDRNNYLLFSRKERIAILSLLLIITIVTFLPGVWPYEKPVFSKPAESYEKELDQLEAVMKNRKEEGNRREEKDSLRERYTSSKKNQLFTFDPNNLSAGDWKRLGISGRTILTIQRYLNKGARFRKPTDLERIYGISPEDVRRLLPYIHIENWQRSDGLFHSNHNSEKDLYRGKLKNAPYPETININTADTSLLISLPGIGSKLAQRIINFREKLGGFYSVSQVAETFGLPDSTYQKIKSRFICPEPAIRKIDVNIVSMEELRQHPYIRWNLAKAIISYREQHGAYQTLEQLEQINTITQEIFLKISPYLIIR